MHDAGILHFNTRNVVFRRKIVSIMYKRVTESLELCIMMLSVKDKTVLGGINQ